MRRIRTFMDVILHTGDGEHQKYVYSTIYGKIMYPVALHPFDRLCRNYYKFNDKENRYKMVR